MLNSEINILIVEDEQNINSFINAILTSDGYGTFCVPTGRKAISTIVDNDLDLVLLDLGLPDIDGMKVLKSVREWSDIPIIVVSARNDELEKVAALDAGANDYITKPFGNNELLARIRTGIRLHERINHKEEDFIENFSVGSLAIDYSKRKVTKNDKLIHLTPIEYKIVVLLSQNAGRVLTHDFIIRHVWGLYESEDQILRVNMANIRRKLEDNSADPKYILTEVRVGYKMIEPEKIN